MANFNGAQGPGAGGSGSNDPFAPPPLRRSLTSGSAEVLSTFSAINSFGHDTAADVLGKTAELARTSKISEQDKIDVQRILLERGTAQAAAHLSTLEQFSVARRTPAAVSPSSSRAAPAVPAPAAAAPPLSPRDGAMDLDEVPAAPTLKKVLSNEGRRLLQSIGEEQQGGGAAAASPKAASPKQPAIPEEKKVKKKKKKKQSYQDLMSSFTAPTQTDDEVRQAHQARLAASLGGGEFSKLDKI